MVYVKTVWKNRIVERPRTFRQQQNADGTVTLVPEEGQIIEAGTPVNAQNLNNIEDAVATHLAEEASHIYYADDTGTANAKVVAINPAITTYKKGLGIAFVNLLANTGAVTINANGIGVKSVLKENGTALTSAYLRANTPYTIRYNGTAFILQGKGGEYGNATAEHVLAPNTIGTDNGVIPGTMPNRGNFNLGLNVPVPAGYYSGGTTPDGKRILRRTIVGDNSVWWINVGFPIGAILSTGTSAGHSFRTYTSQTNSWHVTRGGSYAADLLNITDTSFDFGTYTAGGTYYITVYEK